MMRKLIIISLFIIGLSFEAGHRRKTQRPQAGAESNQWALLIGVGDYPGNTVDLKYPGPTPVQSRIC